MCCMVIWSRPLEFNSEQKKLVYHLAHKILVTVIKKIRQNNVSDEGGFFLRGMLRVASMSCRHLSEDGQNIPDRRCGCQGPKALTSLVDVRKRKMLVPVNEGEGDRHKMKCSRWPRRVLRSVRTLELLGVNWKFSAGFKQGTNLIMPAAGKRK